MRNHRKGTDATGDRLGPLTTLMRTAEPLDELSAAERERIKLRLRSELARNRPVARMRLLTALAGMGLLLAGGVAVAGRLGLIHWPGVTRTSPTEHQEIGDKPQRASRALPKAAVPSTLAGNAVPATDKTLQADPTTTLPAAAPARAAPMPEPADIKAASSLTVGQATRPRRVGVASESPKLRDLASETPAREAHAVSPFTVAPPAPSLGPAPVLPPPVAQPRPVASPSLALVMPPDSFHRIPKTTPAGTTPAPNAQDLLGQAMRSLRRQHDPAMALDILARHAAFFPESPLAGERTQLEVEALLALGRYPEALLRLDAMALDKIPRTAERYLLRGELRAQARRWSEAVADFDQALARIRGSSSWHERALWGRALARAQTGDRLGSRADMRLYVQSYPQGRFAAEAARLSADQP